MGIVFLFCYLKGTINIDEILLKFKEFHKLDCCVVCGYRSCAYVCVCVWWSRRVDGEGRDEVWFKMLNNFTNDEWEYKGKYTFTESV